MRILISALLMIMAVIPSVATAQDGLSPLTEPEQARISNLMHRALEAGRTEANRATADTLLSDDDRRNAQSQFALMLLSAGQCDNSVKYVGEHHDILAGSIERMLLRAYQEGRLCLTNLAGLMLKRWDDPYYNPTGRVRLRYLAAAYLDAAGVGNAHEIMKVAEAELMAQSGHDTLWQARRNAISAYHGTPKYMGYLEYLADRMIGERLLASTIEGRGLLTLFVGRGRCDLVEKVVRNGPTSCDPYKELAEGIYINPRPPANAATMLKRFGVEPPPLTDDSIEQALAKPTPWLRLTKLLGLVSACDKALQGTTS